VGIGKKVSSAKNGLTDLSDLYIIWHVFFAMSFLLGVMMIAPALKFLVALFFNRD